MTLMGLLFSRRKKAFAAVAVLSVLSAVLSVAVLAFISQRLLAGGADLPVVLFQFALLLVALLATATAAQVTLHVLGHRMVYGLRRDLVRRVLATDIEQLEKVGGPHLLAALSTAPSISTRMTPKRIASKPPMKAPSSVMTTPNTLVTAATSSLLKPMST